MIHRTSRIIALLLVVSLSGVAHAAVCMHLGPREARQTQHACCTNPSRTVPLSPSPDDEICGSCTLRNPIPAVPARSPTDAPTPLELFGDASLPPGAFNLSSNPAQNMEVAPSSFPLRLLDLVHTHCQLTA